MSPEQIDGAQAVDQRSDVYSLGVSLYELVAGKTAFASSTKANLIADILHGQVPRLSSLIRDIPRDLETVIHKAMSLHADARYQSASEMAGDLNSFLQGKPVTARRASSLEVIGRWCLRNRSKAALLGLVAAIVLTLAVGGPFIAWRQTTIATRQRHEAYDANMALANDHIEHGEIDQAVVLLKEYLPDVDGSTNDYRSFEWYEMIERCQRRLEATAVPHEWPIRALAASRNGDIAIAPFFQGPVVLSSTNGERLWPAPDNPQLSSSVQALANTPDGRFLLAGGANKKLNLWSTDSQTVVHSEQLAARMSSVATNDQGLIAVGLWPNVSDPFPQTTPAPIVTYQIVEADGHVSLRESSTLVGTMGAAEKIAFAPDGTRLAGASHDGVLRIFLPDKAVYSVVFASNEELVTAGADRRISVWNIADGSLKESINAHADTIREVAVLPRLGQRRLASGGEDNTVRIWNLKEATDRRRLSTPGLTEILDLSFSIDGAHLASTGGDKRVRIWDTRTGELAVDLGQHKYYGHGFDFSPNGKWLASLGSEWPANPSRTELKIWDLATRQCETHELAEVNYGRSLAYSPTGDQIAIVGRRYLVLWNIATAKIEKSIPIDGPGFHVVFSRDGSLIATVSQLWSYPDMQPRFAGRHHGFAVDIHPDNQTVAIGEPSSHEVVILSAVDGKELRRFQGHHDVILHVHFSNDGKRLASASQAGMVIVWNLETGNEIVRYRDHQYWA